jgi:SAM-dependent methyltransferase
MADTISREQLADIQATTLNHYDSNAQSFWEGTRDHDVSQNYEKFLARLAHDRALDILDFGCGPGRDLAYFLSLGHQPVGLDGSANFCAMASGNTGCPVWHQQFLSLHLPQQAFDGIFANASLFHIPGQELPRVLGELHDTLRPGGVLFTSNPRGSAEGWSGQRYGNFMELEDTRDYLTDAGFILLEHYYRPAGMPCAAQPWLATVSQRAA